MIRATPTRRGKVVGTPRDALRAGPLSLLLSPWPWPSVSVYWDRIGGVGVGVERLSGPGPWLRTGRLRRGVVAGRFAQARVGAVAVTVVWVGLRGKSNTGRATAPEPRKEE